MSSYELSNTKVTLLKEGWIFASQLFENYVDYPIYYLRAILSVLRTRMFMNSMPLQWGKWSAACRTTNDMIYAFIICSSCNKLRNLSICNLYFVRREPECLHRPVCADFNIQCDDVDEGLIELPITKTSCRPRVKRIMRVGIGLNPCYVCGTDKHDWRDCPKKKLGRCGCCGSRAHLTRSCGHRYVPQKPSAVVKPEI